MSSLRGFCNSFVRNYYQKEFFFTLNTSTVINQEMTQNVDKSHGLEASGQGCDILVFKHF